MRYLSDGFVRCASEGGEYDGMIGALRGEVDRFMTSFADSPDRTSRWGHRYFCDDDGGRLIFDPDSPREHRCQVCKKGYAGEQLDGTWLTFYRNRAVLTAWKAAAVYAATGDKPFLDAAVRILSFYADNYLRFRLHNKEGKEFATPADMKPGCGRIMPQGLNEAIILCRIVQTLEILRDELPAPFLEGICGGLFQEAFQLLRPQVRSIHNIACWELSAIGMMGLFSGDREMTDFAFNSEFNIRRQLSEGVTADAFWYEGSIHYNFFLLEGVTSLLLFCGVYGHDFGKEEAGTIERMLLNAYDFAFDNGVLPNPNDGWPDINLKTFLHVYHTAARYFGEGSRVAEALRHIENAAVGRVELPLSDACYWQNRVPLERLLLNPAMDLSPLREPPARRSRNFPLSNFAILRQGKLNVFLKYGLQSPSHAHPDIMNIEIAWGEGLVSRDLSNTGYLSRMCNSWHRTTLCHNTVVLNGRNIASARPGECLSFEENCVTAIAREVYDGVGFRRTLTLRNDSLEDVFEVTARDEGTFDYVLHLEAGFILTESPPTLPRDPLPGVDGYEHLHNCRLFKAREGRASVEMACGAQTVSLRFDLCCGKELFLCETPDNPVNRTRTTFIVRSRSGSVTFRTRLTVKEEMNGNQQLLFGRADP